MVIVLIIHRLLDRVAKQILVCENKTIKPWDGSIGDYKNYLRKKMVAAGAV
jgi:ATP-binding cassette subfamily F protein 2